MVDHDLKWLRTLAEDCLQSGDAETFGVGVRLTTWLDYKEGKQFSKEAMKPWDKEALRAAGEVVTW